jgi:hypothetical protein
MRSYRHVREMTMSGGGERIMEMNWNRVGCVKNVAVTASQVMLFGYLMFSAQANPLLDGKQITTAFYFPDQNTIGFGGVPVVSTVGPGIEIAASPQGFPITSIDFSDTSIELNFSRSLVGTVAPFNGWRFYDVSGATFTDATLTTSLPGWVVTFDANDIWLNGSGASYFVGSTLRIDINGGEPPPPAVPEPPSLALLIAGLVGVGVFLGKRFPNFIVGEA